MRKARFTEEQITFALKAAYKTSMRRACGLAQANRSTMYYLSAVGPSMRQVVPLGFRSLARSVIPTGASGHFFEPHYNDQTLLWYGGRTHPAWTDRGSILANAESRLRLVPAPVKKP
jgi:acyl-homoserine lactone acylase PvdQ